MSSIGYKLENLDSISRYSMSSTAKNFASISAFQRDYQNIIFLPAFRRLIDKAQLFPMEQFDYVRTRLTHTLEVEAISEEIISKICMHDHSLKNKKISYREISRCVALIHDIGNPPFGHYGEDIIKRYYSNRWGKLVVADELIKQYGLKFKKVSALLKGPYENDFKCFDGNAQSLRIVTNLSNINGYNNANNLTAAVLGGMIKYPFDSSKDPEKQKFGFFQSETEIVDFLRSQGTFIDGLNNPFSIIMEAADDIAYFVSDIDDAIKKDIITYEVFQNERKTFISNNSIKEGDKLLDFFSDFDKKYEKNQYDSSLPFKTTIQRMLSSLRKDIIYSSVAFVLKECAGFQNLNSSIMKGIRVLFKDENNNICGGFGAVFDFFDLLKKKYVFTFKSIISNELEGDTIMTFLLEEFSKAVLCVSFDVSPAGEIVVKASKNKKYFHEEKTFRLISEHIVKTCARADGSAKDPSDHIYNRLKMVTDYLSGMTDSYAKYVYQLLSGAK